MSRSRHFLGIWLGLALLLRLLAAPRLAWADDAGAPVAGDPPAEAADAGAPPALEGDAGAGDVRRSS